ncbi:helix-turn-helix domain-containing protein [Streptomyces sp. NPDC006463]|uniref:helix-turn-helix domain-containing protein n=1 Tax=Streptomyces sp. NPDC006463 TaxID=3364746 RepID=UPI0036A69C03
MGRGRPRRKISTEAGKTARLARQLDELRPENYTLDDLEKRTGLSKATLSRATKATACPSWDTMVAYLTAFGEDPNEWRPQWEMCATERQRRKAGVPAEAAQRAAYQRMKPTSVLSLDDCAVGLRELRMWKDNPTYAAMSHLAGKRGQPVATTTISDVLTAKVMPTVSAMKGILAGLGMSPEDPEYDEWLQARRVLEAIEMRQKLAGQALQRATNRRVRRTRPMISFVRRED